MPNLTVTKSISGYGTPMGGPATFSGEAYQAVGPFNALYSAPNKEVAITILKDGLKMLAISCSKNCTVKTNDATTPLDTIFVTGGSPFIWTDKDGSTSPIDHADVDTLFVTCTESGQTAACTVVSLGDSTP